MVLAMSIFVPECQMMTRICMIAQYLEGEMNFHQERRQSTACNATRVR